MTKVKIILMAAMLAAALVFSASFAQKDENKTQGWEKMIASRDYAERKAGMQIVLDQYNKIVKDLMDIVNSPVKDGAQFYNYNTSRNMCIYLLGKLRAQEAVPSLIKWIVPEPNQVVIFSESLMFSPAGQALIDIGLPSIPPVAELLKQEKNISYRDEYLKIILAIKGRAETEFFLENMLAKEKDQTKIENIKAAQALLKDPKNQGMFNAAARYAIGIEKLPD